MRILGGSDMARRHPRLAARVALPENPRARGRPIRFGSGAGSAMISKRARAATATAARRGPPGPRGRGLRHALARARNFPRLLDGMGERHGGIVSYRLLNRRFVAISDPDLIREVW